MEPKCNLTGVAGQNLDLVLFQQMPDAAVQLLGDLSTTLNYRIKIDFYIVDFKSILR
jgi:hypothetical protein